MPVTDANDHGQTTFVKPPATPQATLDEVDFDVTKGFDDEPVEAGDEIFDITQGADDVAALPVSEPAPPSLPPAPVAPPVVEAAAVSPPTPTPAGGSPIGIILAVLAVAAAAAAWFLLK